SGGSWTWSSTLMRAIGLAGRGRRRRRHLINPQCILVQQLLAVISRHSIEDALDRFPGLGIVGGNMREIRLPHEVVDANVVAELDAFRFEPEVHEHLPAHSLAWTRGEPLRPQLARLPLVVAGGNDVVEAADAGFGKDKLQIWEALGDAREDQLRNDLRR